MSGYLSADAADIFAVYNVQPSHILHFRDWNVVLLLMVFLSTPFPLSRGRFLSLDLVERFYSS